MKKKKIRKNEEMKKLLKNINKEDITDYYLRPATSLRAGAHKNN